jgi:hypothetical protein
VIPGSLIVTGDLGEMVVSRERDMLPWCRGSVDSTDYFASKVSREFPVKEFSRDVLRNWIEEELSSEDLILKHRTTLENIMDWEIDDNGEEWFYRETEDIWSGCDPPNWKDWTSGFLWKRDAIRWFLIHHEPFAGAGL